MKSSLFTYFIPPAKSVHCRRKRKPKSLDKWICFWTMQIQFRFSDKRADIQVWSYLDWSKNIHNPSAEKRWVDNLQNGRGTSSLWQDHRLGRNDVLVNTSTLAWTYTGDVGVIRRNTKETEDAHDNRPTLHWKIQMNNLKNCPLTVHFHDTIETESKIEKLRRKTGGVLSKVLSVALFQFS